MKEKKQFPSRDHLNHAFHQLHEQITRISVEEEVEMMREDPGEDEE